MKAIVIIMKKLGRVPKGSRVEVVAVRGEGDLTGRLSALGFLPGKTVEIIHIAPLRDPITVRIDDLEISIRRADADHVEVRSIETRPYSPSPA